MHILHTVTRRIEFVYQSRTSLIHFIPFILVTLMFDPGVILHAKEKLDASLH